MQVIQFPTIEGVVNIDGKPVQKPKHGYQYLLMCKEILDIQDYEEVLLAIMDEEYYQTTDIEIRAMVDVYYTFNS
jgi:hypothetical protein